MSLSITILTDESSWMNKFNKKLASFLNEAGHDVKLIRSRSELIKGDVAFFLSCFEIVGKKFLVLNKHNIVVHASALPKGKGWSPATWQILDGKNEIPLTLFEATEKVDAGDIYIRDIIKLNGSELIDEWREKLGEKIIEMCLLFIEKLMKKNLKMEAQNDNETFYPRRSPEDSRIDPEKTISEQFNLFRVVDNDFYPAFFDYKGCRYSLKISKIQ